MGIKLEPLTQTWIAYWQKRHPITRQPVSLRRKGIKTQAEAKRVERELIVAVEDRIRRKLKPTWESLVQQYCDYSKNQGMMLITIENYFLCLRAHTFTEWGSRLADDITTDEIRELVRGKEKTHSTSHQKNILKMIRGVFKFAIEKGYINRNPVPQLKFRQGDKIRCVLTERQAKQLLTKAEEYKSEWYSIWATALYTGMRSGELYALTWDKVDFERNQILVNCSWNNKDGFKSTKSGDDRIIDIAPALLSLLLELKIQSSDRTFVLPRIKEWEDGYQASALRQFLIGIRIPPIRFHDLRASWATMLLNKGVEPVKVMAMGGWKDIKTMMIYMRKAGVDIKGSLQCLSLHNPTSSASNVINLEFRS